MNGLSSYSMSRSLDGLGRIVIPKEMRQILNWNETDQIFIGIRNGIVFMKKFEKVCPVCRNPFDNEKGLNVCHNCLDSEIRNFQS